MISLTNVPDTILVLSFLLRPTRDKIILSFRQLLKVAMSKVRSQGVTQHCIFVCFVLRALVLWFDFIGCDDEHSD